MTVVDGHHDLHSEAGAVRGEHPGRARNPVIKVRDLAWLEFTKPDLDRAARFAEAFGFSVSGRTPGELQLRGADAGGPCVIVRRGPRSGFRGMAFVAAEAGDLLRLAEATGCQVVPLPESLGGAGVDLQDPSGLTVRVVHGGHELPAAPAQAPQLLNTGRATTRVNLTQRPPRVPTVVQRLGHVVLQRTSYRRNLDWYLEHLGLIVSDFQFFPGQRKRGPTMSFIRCDLGPTPADHHTVAMMLGPADRYVHSAYQVADLDALAAGGEYLRQLGYRRSWGIGRHVQGSQIFDYWRDPDGFLVEHFTDGDRFDASLEPGWAPMTASGLAQWGPPATADFLGVPPSRQALHEARAIVDALRDTGNEFDLTRLFGLMRMARR